MDFCLIMALILLLCIGLVTEFFDRRHERSIQRDELVAELTRQNNVLRTDNDTLSVHIRAQESHLVRIRDDKIEDLEREISEKDKIIANLKRAIEGGKA